MAAAVRHDSRSGDFPVTEAPAPWPCAGHRVRIGSAAPLDHKNAKRIKFKSVEFATGHARLESSTSVRYRPSERSSHQSRGHVLAIRLFTGRQVASPSATRSPIATAPRFLDTPHSRCIL